MPQKSSIKVDNGIGYKLVIKLLTNFCPGLHNHIVESIILN